MLAVLLVAACSAAHQESPLPARLLAYLTADHFAVIKNEEVLVRASGTFRPDSLRWTADGRFALALTDVKQGPSSITVLDVDRREVRTWPCWCLDAKPMSGDEVWFADERPPEYVHRIMSISLTTPETAAREVLLPGLQNPDVRPGERAWRRVDILGRLNGTSLIAAQKAYGAKEAPERLFEIHADGSTTQLAQTSPIYGREVFAKRTAYQQAVVALPTTLADGCQGTTVALFLLAEKVEKVTDMRSTHIDDMWWGQDGKLHAAVSVGDCTSESAAPTVWRLEGLRWERHSVTVPARALRTFSPSAYALVGVDHTLTVHLGDVQVRISAGVVAIDAPPL